MRCLCCCWLHCTEIQQYNSSTATLRVGQLLPPGHTWQQLKLGVFCPAAAIAPASASAHCCCRTTTFLTYSGRRSQDTRDLTANGDGSLGSPANGTLGGGGSASASERMDAVAEADGCEGEFSDAQSGGPSACTSTDGAGDGAAAKLASVRAAVAEQEAREVPEDELWAVQVRCCWACLAKSRRFRCRLFEHTLPLASSQSRACLSSGLLTAPAPGSPCRAPRRGATGPAPATPTCGCGGGPT